MPCAKIHAENQDQHRGQQQREIGKTVASEVAELFAHDRGYLRRKQTQSIGAIVLHLDCTDGGTSRRRGFAKFFAAILRGKATPQKSAEQYQVSRRSAKLNKNAAG